MLGYIDTQKGGQRYYKIPSRYPFLPIAPPLGTHPILQDDKGCLLTQDGRVHG